MLVNHKSIVRTLLVINNYCMSTFVFKNNHVLTRACGYCILNSHVFLVRISIPYLTTRLNYESAFNASSYRVNEAELS